MIDVLTDVLTGWKTHVRRVSAISIAHRSSRPLANSQLKKKIRIADDISINIEIKYRDLLFLLRMPHASIDKYSHCFFQLQPTFSFLFLKFFTIRRQQDSQTRGRVSWGDTECVLDFRPTPYNPSLHSVAPKVYPFTLRSPRSPIWPEEPQTNRHYHGYAQLPGLTND